MKLENQVVSLDLAKRLKELGVKQESLFYWHDSEVISDDSRLRVPEDVSAFTVAELGEMLPVNSETKRIAVTNEWYCRFRHWKANGHGYDEYQQDAKTEADARAKMLIYLLEKGLIQIPT
jgi:hypothetical protein